jgi:hypothetical protein
VEILRYVAAAVQAGHESPGLSLVTGRAAMVRGDAAAALNCAAAVAARDSGVRLASPVSCQAGQNRPSRRTKRSSRGAVRNLHVEEK